MEFWFRMAAFVLVSTGIATAQKQPQPAQAPSEQCLSWGQLGADAFESAPGFLLTFSTWMAPSD